MLTAYGSTTGHGSKFGPARAERRHWGLAHRSVARPAGHLFYIAYCPNRDPLDELTGIACSRWAIEECVQGARQGSGLDDYQIRRYPGWQNANMTLAMGTRAYLTGLRARELDTDT